MATPKYGRGTTTKHGGNKTLQRNGDDVIIEKRRDKTPWMENVSVVAVEVWVKLKTHCDGVLI